MKKTLNINIAGQLFSIDEEAWQILSRYLEHVSTRFRQEPGAEETIADIESRIAEIFGGGSEPPRLVSREMVDKMIATMGAPEDYYDETTASTDRTRSLRKALYDPDSLLARAGQAFSALRKAGGMVLSKVLRFFAVTLGTVFAILGFLLLVLFALFFFFNDAQFITAVTEPHLVNLKMLFSILLNGQAATTIWQLAAIVILLPLAALSYLGIKLVFKIKKGPKIVRVLLFTLWLAAGCLLAVLLALRFTTYAHHDRSYETIQLTPPPETVWIAPLKKISELKHDEQATVDLFHFWRNSATGQLFCTAELNIYGSDTTSAWLSIEKRAHSNSKSGARANLRAIDFTWKFSRDTLYLDEYVSLPAKSSWNASMVELDLCLPEGTVIKAVPGCALSNWLFRERDPDAPKFRIKNGGVQTVTEG